MIMARSCVIFKSAVSACVSIRQEAHWWFFLSLVEFVAWQRTWVMGEDSALIRDVRNSLGSVATAAPNVF